MKKPVIVTTVPCLQFEEGYVHSMTNFLSGRYPQFETGARVRVCRVTSNPHWPQGKYIYSLQIDDAPKRLEMSGADLDGLYLCLNQADCRVKEVELI